MSVLKGYKVNMLSPQYLNSFRCIGSLCEDTCCKGWKVEIDRNTFNKYKDVKHSSLKLMLEKYINRDRISSSDNNYAKVKNLENSLCPFLDEQSLCMIQSQLGEGYLSKTCAMYPRSFNWVNGIFEMSSAISCPEIARKVLLNPDRMEFDMTEREIDERALISVNIDTDLPSLSNNPMKCFWELREFTIDLFQNRRFEIWERLLILGLFYKSIDDYVNERTIGKIPELINKYKELANDESIKEELSRIPVQNKIQMQLLKELADSRFSMGTLSVRYLECLSAFLSGVDYNGDSTIEEIGGRYDRAYKDYYLPFMSSRQYIFENYLVNYTFKNLVPIPVNKSYFEAFMVIVVHYALIKMLLIGMSGFHKGLTEELVIKLFQSFAKTVEHIPGYTELVLELLKKNQYNNIAYMSILIKN